MTDGFVVGSKPVAFEIPVDDLKVPSGQLTTSKSQTNLDPEALKEKLKGTSVLSPRIQ